SPAAGSGLSSHELNQPGTYRNVKDTSAVAMFKASDLKNENASESLQPVIEAQGRGEEVFFLAWTTTPWTLPSNLGLTVGPAINYSLVKTFNPYTHLPIDVILASSAISRYFKPEGENASFEEYTSTSKVIPWKVLAEFKGADLEGLAYEQLLPYEANSREAVEAITPGAQPFKLLLGDFVNTEDGTGIVHTAPAFGADDFRVGKKYGIGILTLVDRQGKFVEGLGEFSGRYIKDYIDQENYVDVNIDISVKLKKENRAFKVEKYEHSYPHCWRTDKPVVYYPLDAWFIRTTALRERMVELNNTINWKPQSTGTGRFGNWLENMVDWNLSRSRFWGTPLPIWRTEDGTEEICIGSVDELNREIRKANEILEGDVNMHYLHDGILDLHKPYVDEVILVSETGKPMYREPDLIDVWFDSGAMPYAQWGLPEVATGHEVTPSEYAAYIAEREGRVDSGLNKWNGADFIAEGVDQTRGWFYTLHALASMLFDTVAFKTCVSNGLVLDKNGNKMSKRLGNAVDPFATIEQFGADATRWYLVTNASPWDNLKFDSDGIKEVQRKFFGTLYNTYQFFALYANVDNFTFKEDYIPVEQRPEIDRWILSSLNTLIKKVTAAFDDYEPTVAGRLVEDFVDEHLSNWYVRLCRRRFWKGEYEFDKISAYQTLYECIDTVVRLMAPISPFFSDEIYRNLNNVTCLYKEKSVHHHLIFIPKEELIDTLLEERMQLAQDASSLILSIRKKANIKVRQPLQKVLIPVLYPAMEQQLRKVEDLIKAEVNVKEVEYLSETEGFIKKKIKPNFVALGKKLGPKMKAVSSALSNFSQHEISLFEKEGRYSIPVNDEYIELTRSEVEITSEDIPGWSVAGKGPLTVALDINVTPELVEEGNAREFVNRIQKIRKDSGLDVTDRIDVKVAARNGIALSLAKFNDYICAEILADKLEITSDIQDGIEIDINDNPLKVIVLKKGN
ncbi:MAG: isoleucine--tRNA ligase, partial [Candidatus Dadabacteria bacterium]